mgnify:CR=1 FL=1
MSRWEQATSTRPCVASRMFRKAGRHVFDEAITIVCIGIQSSERRLWNRILDRRELWISVQIRGFENTIKKVEYLGRELIYYVVIFIKCEI